MQCERLKKLVRNWSNQIVEDALAPARMVDFVAGHIKSCAICRADSTVSADPLKIRKMVVPFISAKDPQKAARFEDILEHYSTYEEKPELEEKIPEEEEEGIEELGDTEL